MEIGFWYLYSMCFSHECFSHHFLSINLTEGQPFEYYHGENPIH